MMSHQATSRNTSQSRSARTGQNRTQRSIQTSSRPLGLTIALSLLREPESRRQIRVSFTD